MAKIRSMQRLCKSGLRVTTHFTAEQKVAILKKYLVDKVPMSDLCDQHQIQPNQVYQWQKLLFENAVSVFERPAAQNKAQTEADQKIAALEQKLQKKNEVVAELMEDHVRLKKELGEL